MRSTWPTRERVALFDITPFAKFDVTGPDALAYLERICANRIDRPVGTVVYTAMLTPSGGIRCDLTVTRKDEELFRVVTGGGSGQHDLAWMRAQIRASERVAITERTGSLFALGLWGPRARDVLGAVTDEDVSNEAFPYLTAQVPERRRGRARVGAAHLVRRRARLGAVRPVRDGRSGVGRVVGGGPASTGSSRRAAARSTRSALEKGYRLWGQDIDTEHDPFEAGLGFAVRMDKGEFQGRAALEAILERGPTDKLSCMTFDDPSVVVMGKEPIWSGDRVVSYVTSASYGYTIGRGIVYGYLPVELADEGTPVEVEYFGERHAATVAADPLWDPKGERQKDCEETMSDDELDLSALPDDELTKQMHDDLYDGLAAEIVEGTNILLGRGWGADRVLNDALVEGMRIVGIDFRDGILFVPEVLLAANAMKAGMEILRPLLAETGAERIGKVVIGTVKGDIHDIGKNLVAMMLEGAGFEVVDLGINNPVEKYLAALEEHKPDILGMSALLTTTMPYMKVVIDTMVEKGIRDDYIVLVGGAPLNEEFGKAVGADAYCRDAAVAAETAQALVLARRAAATA